MTEKNHVFLTEVVSGICTICTCRTMLVGFNSTFYRCTVCGNELEQKINGVIKYIKANKNTRIEMTEHNGHGNKA